MHNEKVRERICREPRELTERPSPAIGTFLDTILSL
jgi:hypothetical protein